MRILVVEDEHKIANAIKRGLQQESFAVDAEYDADTGLAAAMHGDYDLLILDIMLPGSLDGVEICKELRKAGKHLPILLLTAKDGVRDRVKGLNSGADDYLVKPFAFVELLARVRALLRRPIDNIGNVIKVADLSLNTQTFEAKRAGQPINLTPKEFSLLEYLMRHSGQIVTKDQIIEHVWNFDADILPNTVEVYAGYLRKKIDKNQSQQLIKTVRGFGYKIG